MSDPRRGLASGPWRALAAVVWLQACAARPAPTPRVAVAPVDAFVDTVQGMQVVMGTRLRVAVERRADAAALLARAFAIARSWDAALSTYQPGSALSRLNRDSGASRRLRSPQLGAFLRASQRLCRATAGAFDVSLGAGCGCYRLIPPESSKPLELRWVRRAALDPGAIGKGLAVDQIVAMLRAAKVRRAFIDFGGSSFYGLGGPWRVALPTRAGRGSPRVLTLRDQALSSSRSYSPAGRAHIVDPRDRRRVRARRLGAAKGPSATDAEALSTALVVDPASAPRWRARFASYELLVGQ
jgi:thiamine biosynthesis lipoprotein